MNRVAFILFVITLFTACKKEQVQVIPSEFEEFVAAFFEAGNQRGLDLNLEEVDLRIQFGTLDGNIGGQCSFRNNTITIDPDDWNFLSEAERMWLMFHELGHCVLDRSHKNEETDNADCVSIMRGAENDFECSLNVYSSQWWAYYLDELFDSNTPWPNWYGLYEDFDAVNTISTLADLELTENYLEFNDIDFSQYENFNIDFEFQNLNTNQNLVKFYLGNIGFSHCDVCSGTNVNIASDTPQQEYYRNDDGDIRFESDIKLTIRKIESGFYFYVNERFVHTFESDLWSGNQIRTISMNEAIPLRLSVTEIE